MNNKKIVFWIIYGVFIIILVVVCIEAFFQFQMRRSQWHAPSTQFDAELGWSPIANHSTKHKGKQVTTNSLGFRSAELNPEKKQIAVIGDSVAWGFGVDDENAMPAFLNKSLDPYGYQVQNMAVAGYGLDQEYLYLKRNIKHFNNLKYIVLIVFSYNDFTNTSSNTAYGKRKPLFKISDGKLQLDNIPIKKYNMRNVISMSRFLGEMFAYYGGMGKIIGNWAGDETLGLLEGQKVIDKVIDQIYSLAEDNDAKLVVVLSPPTYDFVLKGDYYKWFDALLKQKSQQTNFYYISYFDYLKRYVGDLNIFYQDWGHFTPKGNEFMTQVIFEYIQKIEKKL